MMNKLLLFTFFIWLITACKDTKKNEVDVSNISINTTVKRFDKQFFNTSKANFLKVKKEYPYLFPKEVADSVWLQKIQNTEERRLYEKSQNVFGDFIEEEEKLTRLFQHITYYNPQFKIPKTVTLISNLDAENSIIYADSLLLISLDMYLGAKDTIYAQFPEYLAKNYKKSQLLPNVAVAIINAQYQPKHQRQFINTMINEGKKMYMMDLYLPRVSDAEKIGFTSQQIQWTQQNEMAIWKYFVENELIYSTDSKLYERFIANAPFSKFYTEIDRDSPGRIGVWLGWQIVRSFMKNNDVSLQKLWQTDGTAILKQSYYKPQK